MSSALRSLRLPAFPLFLSIISKKEIFFGIRIVDHRKETVIDPVGIGNDVALCGLTEDLSQPDDREHPAVDDVLQKRYPDQRKAAG